MDWNPADGPFVADRGLLALYTQTGRVLPDRMLAEWRLGPGDARPGMDEAEMEAFTDMVRAFTLAKPARPVNVFVPWCLNDYQIDVGTAEGRVEYKRVLDVAAELGAEYAIFAPTNSDLAKREDSTDDWSWENLLWAGFGQKVRKNEWHPKTGPVPPSVQEMLDYAADKKVKLLAYVYPVLAFSQNPDWLTSRKNNPKRLYGNLGFRSLQDWLIETLVAFHDRLGLGGYAFDHAFLNIDGTSRYAQWAGWRRVMEELRRRIPDIVIDGRQAYHLYGPWGWLAGSYPHPTFNDEQPESFMPFPDLHVDRVSADRERWTAYRYRNYEFAPSELVPGFITHQTSRADDPARCRETEDRPRRHAAAAPGARLGLPRLALLAPLVDCRRRVEQRARHDPGARRRGVQELLGRGQEVVPAVDRLDCGQQGVPAPDADDPRPAGHREGRRHVGHLGDRGYIFLFNPNGRRIDAEFRWTPRSGSRVRGPVLLKELYPLENRLVGKPGSGLWSAGDRVSLSLDGGSALVLEVQPAPERRPRRCSSARRDRLRLQAARCRSTACRARPARRRNWWWCRRRAPGDRRSGQRSVPVVHAYRGRGDRDSGDVRRHPVRPVPADRRRRSGRSPAGDISARFTVPQRVFDQLAARRKAWPIPWTAEDYRTTWLAPERLLLFVQIAEPDPAWEARLTIDGRTVELRKAYSAVRTAPRTFVGFYADLSLRRADREHTLELELPRLRPGQLQGVFFENVETEYTEVIRK